MHCPFLERRAAPACRIVAFVATCLICMVGCEGPAREANQFESARPTADLTVVHNRFDSLQAGGWSLEAPLRVGGAEGEAAFGRVADVAPRAAGGMWVLDGQSKRVAGFDEEGRLVVRFGGDGAGPGEMRNARSVFETGAGRVAVGAPFPPALHWFEGDGEYVGSLRVTDSFDANGAPLPPRFARWSVARSGRAFVDLFSLPSLAGDAVVRHTVSRFEDGGLAGARRDTVISWTVAATPSDPSARLSLVATVPRWTTGPEEMIWWTPGSPYEIRSYDGSGKPVRTITLDRPAVPVTREVREAIAEGLRASATDAGGDLGIVEDALSRAEWPELLPHVSELWVSFPDGQVFSAPYRTESFQPGAPKTLDVFEPDGGYSGTLILPARFSPRQFGGGYVYGVETDDLDLEYAVRYRLLRTGRAVTP